MLLIFINDLIRISCFLAIPLLLNLVISIPRILSLDNRTTYYNVITADLMGSQGHDPFLVSDFWSSYYPALHRESHLLTFISSTLLSWTNGTIQTGFFGLASVLSQRRLQTVVWMFWQSRISSSLVRGPSWVTTSNLAPYPPRPSQPLTISTRLLHGPRDHVSQKMPKTMAERTVLGINFQIKKMLLSKTFQIMNDFCGMKIPCRF